MRLEVDVAVIKRLDPYGFNRYVARPVKSVVVAGSTPCQGDRSPATRHIVPIEEAVPMTESMPQTERPCPGCGVPTGYVRCLPWTHSSLTETPPVRADSTMR